MAKRVVIKSKAKDNISHTPNEKSEPVVKWEAQYMAAKLKVEQKLDNSMPTIILLTKEQAEGKAKTRLSADIEKAIMELRKKGLFSGEEGSAVPLQVGGRVFLLAGLGEAKEMTLTSLRCAVRAALYSQYLKNATDVNIFTEGMDKKELVAIAEGALLGLYAWKKYVTKDHKNLEKDKVVHIAGDAKLLERTALVCSNINRARDMINENAEVMNSLRIEKEVRESIRGARNVRLEVLDRRALKAKGLNLVLAVNSGSRHEPRLIIARYNGGGKEPYTALIGKGITFDAGGLNLKPEQSMLTMRDDKAGAAAVLAVLRNALAMKLKRNLIFAFGIAENAIGSRAYKPGDVIKSYEGRTVEVESTDAEGRLVLADANAYVNKNYKPGTIINIATLTYAVRVALGNDYIGLMTNSQPLANRLLKSAEETDDRAWQLPIYKELQEHVKSKYADIKNLGLPKGEAGAISAGEFLRQFCGDAKWAHFDIGGTGFVEGDGRWYYGYGATGSGIRLLTDFIMK